MKVPAEEVQEKVTQVATFPVGKDVIAAKGDIPFAVTDANGGEKVFFPEGSTPLVTIKTHRSDARLLKTVSESGKEGFKVRVSEEGLVVITLYHPEYVLVSPDTELVDVNLEPSLLKVANPEEYCRTAGACRQRANIVGASPHIANQEALQEQQAVANAALFASSVVMPAAANTGAKMSVLAMVTRAMLCPGTGPDKLDRTLNPLGLKLGGGEFREYNGAVVGALIFNATLFLVCAVAAAFLFGKIKRRTTEDLHQDTCGKINKANLLVRARFGWLLIPYVFLYGGSGVGAITAIISSELIFKLLGAVLFVSFVAGVPLYVFKTVRDLRDKGKYVDFEGEQSLMKRVFWGKSEWVENSPADEQWFQLHHLAFDGYIQKWRFFLFIELIFVLILSSLTALQPATKAACSIRAIVMTILLALFTLLLLATRPYVAPYENVGEITIYALETAMMVVTVVAMADDNPTVHWGSDAASVLAQVVMYFILLKFVVDSSVFVLDEYHYWRDIGGQGGMGSFALYWFCMVGSQKNKPFHELDSTSSQLERLTDGDFMERDEQHVPLVTSERLPDPESSLRHLELNPLFSSGEAGTPTGTGNLGRSGSLSVRKSPPLNGSVGRHGSLHLEGSVLGRGITRPIRKRYAHPQASVSAGTK